MDQMLIFSEERQTWNLFVNGEWYFEGDYETCEEMMMNNAADYYEPEYEPDDYYGDEDYEEVW